ncbi:uncharacterized protein LOC135486330 [Lineus longissimus]|uniref:uncharacterized protein LOC135486330 n=1 Tax=Lineus longissimus TaxID=88925 RepID=UPI002B4D2D5A
MAGGRDVHLVPMMNTDFKELERRHLNRVKFSPMEEEYLSKYLLYVDETQRVSREKCDPIVAAVERTMLSMQARLQETPAFSNGWLTECGSFFEDTKVGEANEFDYIYLVSRQDFVAENVQIKLTKPAKSDITAKAFYKLYMNHGLNSGSFTRNVSAVGGPPSPFLAAAGAPVDDTEIHAWKLHHDFYKVIEEIIRDMFDLKDDTRTVVLKKAGPAVKLVLLIHEGDKKSEISPRFVKIDISLALEANARKLLDDKTLRSYASFLHSMDQLKCHFVPAHDYWKLSFAAMERDLMNKTSAKDYKGVCYRAIKILRDQVDVKDTLGDGILSSYPLKVTHLKKTLSAYIKDEKDTWTRDNIGRNVVAIARAVDKDGERNKLSGLFLRNDNIISESDRSYLESRRILTELKNLATDYKVHGCLHTVSWLILLLCSIGIISIETVTWNVVDWDQFHNDCEAYWHNKTDFAIVPHDPIDVTFLFVYSILSWLLLLTNLISLSLVHILAFKMDKPLFRVLPNLRAIYVVTTLAAAALCAFDIFIIIDFIKDNGCIHLGEPLTLTISAWTIRFLASVPIFLLLISFVVNAIYYRDRRTCTGYDVIFFSCPCCAKGGSTCTSSETDAREDPYVDVNGRSFRSRAFSFPSILNVHVIPTDTLNPPDTDEE